MAHRSRKHRKGSRKHRKSHSRKHSQRGGNGCSAYPTNRAAFSQSGGMAPFAASGNDYLLDAATRVQAEVGPLDRAFGELPSVIPKQGGGRRHRKASRKGSRKHRKSHRKGRRNQSRRSRTSRFAQRGGNLYPFSGPSLLLSSGQYATDGTNPQFRTEGSVNALYGEFKGAQA